MKRGLAAGVVVMVCLGRAEAKSPFAALLDPSVKRTYDVIERATGEATGEHVTLSVEATERHGAYTRVDILVRGDGKAQFSSIELMVGPKGVREVPFLREADHDERHFRDAYGHHYLPRVYLPAALKPQRFRDDTTVDDHVYHVAGDFTKVDPHTWRMTWKGRSVVPDGEVDESNGETPYASVIEFDPDAGFTWLCPIDIEGSGLCLRLQR